ncbi:unnamed protein product [Ranitomeya imitator]|uniref:Coiled-coil domain-containing protein 43 n=2 Tax=Ranitomeya imitator TaxID=111125 RepID=A0ABN9M3A1_9NEOB|nr:unnamed protein product [Ranitomeya imitator]
MPPAPHTGHSATTRLRKGKVRLRRSRKTRRGRHRKKMGGPGQVRDAHRTRTEPGSPLVAPQLMMTNIVLNLVATFANTRIEKCKHLQNPAPIHSSSESRQHGGTVDSTAAVQCRSSGFKSHQGQHRKEINLKFSHSRLSITRTVSGKDQAESQSGITDNACVLLPRIAPPPRVGPQPGWKMAAPSEQVVDGDFGAWLDERLEALGMDPEVYPAYIKGVLREEDNAEERDEALRGILSAFLEEDSIEDVCLEIVTKWCEAEKASRVQAKADDEVEALTSMIEKQAQIVVKPKEVSEVEQQRKAALLAQYANVTDDEAYPSLLQHQMTGLQCFYLAADNKGIQVYGSALFKNTNLEDLVNARKHERDALREASQKKKEQDKQQRDKDKQAKQDRKEKEKKRTQKGERKR